MEFRKISQKNVKSMVLVEDNFRKNVKKELKKNTKSEKIIIPYTSTNSHSPLAVAVSSTKISPCYNNGITRPE